MNEWIPYVRQPCPVCGEAVERTKDSPINREIHLHILRAHIEEIRARLDNPNDSVIAKLEEIEIYFNKRDIDRMLAKPNTRKRTVTNAERFREAYAVKLAEALQKHPEEYAYGPDKIPGVLDKMIPSLKVGDANLGPATKAAARALGLKPTMRDIKRYLQLDDTPCARSMGCLCNHHANGGDVATPCNANE